jgi:hypothetical protein
MLKEALPWFFFSLDLFEVQEDPMVQILFFGLDIIWFTMSVILVPILHVFSCEFTFISQRIEWMRRWHVLLRCSSTVLGHVTADAHARGKNCERMELAGCWPKHVWWLIREVNEEEGRQECANLFHTFTLTLCTMVVCRLKWTIFPLLLKKYSLSCLPFFFFWYLYSGTEPGSEVKGGKVCMWSVWGGQS